MNFIDVYKIRLSTIQLLFIKRLRRYGSLKANVFDSNGSIKDILVFTMKDEKITLNNNNMIFDNINSAWKYYESEIKKYFNDTEN